MLGVRKNPAKERDITQGAHRHPEHYDEAIAVQVADADSLGDDVLAIVSDLELVALRENALAAARTTAR